MTTTTKVSGLGRKGGLIDLKTRGDLIKGQQPNDIYSHCLDLDLIKDFSEKI